MDRRFAGVAPRPQCAAGGAAAGTRPGYYARRSASARRGDDGTPAFRPVADRKRLREQHAAGLRRLSGRIRQGLRHAARAEFAEAVRHIRDAGGIASLAHPVRLREDVAAILPELRAAGLNAIEAYHSDHSPSQTALYLELAAQHGLLVTGGSDFHGAVKPEIRLGTGRGGNLKVPDDLVDRLKAGLRARAKLTGRPSRRRPVSATPADPASVPRRSADSHAATGSRTA